MDSTRVIRKCLAVLGLALIAGCSSGNGADSYTELSVSGGGNQVFVSSPGFFRIGIPKQVTAIEMRVTQPTGSIRLQSGEPNDSITGVIKNASVAAETGPTGATLSIGIRGTGEPSTNVELRLPARLQVTLRLDQGKGDLMTDLSRLSGGRVVLSDHTGNVILALPGGAGQEVEIQRDEGAVTIQVPTSAALLVRGNGAPVQVPQSFHRVAEGEYASPSYKDGASATVVNVNDLKGSIEVQTK